MIYERRNNAVAAMQWRGDNLAEVEAFLEAFTGKTAEELGVRNEEDQYRILGKLKKSNVLLFYAWNDDQEVDEGKWIVIELGEHNTEARGYTLSDYDFHEEFRKKADDAS